MMNEKAKKFSLMLEENNITVFAMRELQDEFNGVAYNSNMEIHGEVLPVAIVMDDSIYTMIAVQVASSKVNDKNVHKVMEFLNELNAKYKITKYSVDEQGNIVLNVCICSTAENFDSELIRAVVDVMIKQLEDVYPQIMKQIWQ